MHERQRGCGGISVSPVPFKGILAALWFLAFGFWYQTHKLELE
jgi:hypothetical protein